MSEPTITLTESQIKSIVKAALDEHFERLGINTEDVDDRLAAQRDFMFLRRIRVMLEQISAKVGSAVILAVVGGFIALLMAGFNLKFGK